MMFAGRESESREGRYGCGCVTSFKLTRAQVQVVTLAFDGVGPKVGHASLREDLSFDDVVQAGNREGIGWGWPGEDCR